MVGDCPAGRSLNGLRLEQDQVAKEVVKDSWGTWLSDGWDWDWWVTLTYDLRKLVSGSTTHTGVGWARSAQDWDRWLTELTHEAAKDDALSPPYWFRGREPNPYRYGTHFHALVGGVQGVSRRAAWSRWFDAHGHARIEPYDPRRGAGWYVAKYVVKELGDLTFSPNAGLWMKEARRDDGSNSERTNDEQGYFDGWRGPVSSRDLPGRPGVAHLEAPGGGSGGHDPAEAGRERER